MRIHVFPLDWMGQPPLLEPRDKKLHDLAVDFCKRELAKQPDLSAFSKVWVAVEEPEFDEDHKLISGTVLGMTGYVLKPDIPLFRVAGPNASRATKMLTDRLHDYFADVGLRGQEVFVHLSSKETPEQKCAGWQEGLAATEATLADRFSVIVR